MRISDWSSDVCSSDLDRKRSSSLRCRTPLAPALAPALSGRPWPVRRTSPASASRLNSSKRHPYPTPSIETGCPAAKARPLTWPVLAHEYSRPAQKLRRSSGVLHGRAIRPCRTIEIFSVTHQRRREPAGEGRSPKPASASEFGIVGHRRPILLRRRDIARAVHIPLRLHLLIEVQVKLSIDDRIGERVAGREIAARHRPRAMPAISRHERRRIGPEFRRMIGAREMIDRTVMLDGKGGVALHRHPVALEIAHRVIAAYRDVAAVNTAIDRQI